MADPYEQAFAELQQTYIDLDGDGRPDIVVGADPMREINRRMGPMTPSSRAGMPPAEIRASDGPQSPLQQIGSAILDYGPLPAQMFVKETGDLGRAVYEMQNDPSLANVANVGVRGAMLAGRPLAAGAIGGTAMLEAARRDFAPDIFRSSTAQSFLTPEQQSELASVRKRISEGKFKSGAERRDLEGTAKRLGDLEAELMRQDAERKGAATAAEAANREAQRAADEQRRSQEDAAARARANAAYQAGLATDRRFSDTTLGQVFDKFGPVAPGVVAAGTGLVSGLGMRGMGVTNKIAKYGVPVGVGTLAGGASANWPMAYEAMYAPTVNPNYAAAINYIREAPPNDPRAAQLKALIADGTLKEENTVRTSAERELYDPVKLKERTAFGAIEGAIGGLAGGEAAPAVGYLIKSAPGAAYDIGRIPGNLARGVRDGFLPPAKPPRGQKQGGQGGGGGGQPPQQPPQGPSPYDGSGLLPVGSAGRRVYPSEGTPARDFYRGEYADFVEASGKTLDPATANKVIQAETKAAGYQLPKVTDRVQRINDKIAAFAQQFGRMPTGQEVIRLYDRQTLAVPMAIGAGAAASSPLIDLYDAQP